MEGGGGAMLGDDSGVASAQTSGGRSGGGSGWETHRVRLNRVAGFGFGIAVSGGRDNPHFASGDPSIAVSDVLRGGPAEDKLQVNDRIISVNGVSVENVEYARAVQVLRECGASVTLVVRRRVPAPPHTASTTLHFTLSRHNKKEDWGVELGCRIYVKRLSQRAKDQLNAAGHSLCEGDVITNINNTTLSEETTLKEARKLLASCRERVALQVSRELAREETVTSLHPPGVEALSPTYSGQNLYVSAPSRDQHPPRPPPPSTNDYYGNGRAMYEEESRGKPPPEPRLISFQKEGSVGVRVCGGNRSGVFVSGVQPASPAALQGLQPADKILKVNEMEMNGVTREEAVLFLLSLQERIDLIVQHAPAEYAAVARNDTPGDWFHIRTHFHYAEPADGELAFRSGDVFRVIDTLHNGTVGAWRVARIGRNNSEVQKGIIPNKARAEELATAQFNALKKEAAAGSERAPGGLFRRRRSTHRRAKSLGKEQWEEVVLESSSKLPAYERVVLRAPGPPRPVVLLGACADLAAHTLTQQQPHNFTQPLCSEDGSGGVVRASWVRGAGERGLHAVLAVPPAAVLRLNYAQLYPIVVFLKPDSKQTIKRLRQGAQRGVGSRKSSKKVLEECVWVERSWSHVVTHTLSLSESNAGDWTDKLRDMIAAAQQQHIWVSENTMRWGAADDLVCALGAEGAGQSRLSYASSPESEPDSAPATAPSALPRATSQPALAPPQHPHYTSHHPPHQPPPAYTVNGVSDKYGLSMGGDPPPPRTPLYGTVPELPPRSVGVGGGGGGTGPRVSAHERLFPSATEPTHLYSPHQSGYEYGSAGVGPNAPDDLKVAPTQKAVVPAGGGAMEIPSYTHSGLYTHARAVSLPAPPAPPAPAAQLPAPLHNPDYVKYRSGTYKPVPPPKPKHYRAPEPHTHAHHHAPPPTQHNTTGAVDSNTGNGSWSHTHSQPDHYTHALRYTHDSQPVAGPPQSPPYAAPPPPRLQHIDLAGSREQRGSAFQLYRKPHAHHVR